jgi:hypothetical protein
MFVTSIIERQSMAALTGVDCRKLLQNADKIIDVNILEDPSYRVTTDLE